MRAKECGLSGQQPRCSATSTARVYALPFVTAEVRRTLTGTIRKVQQKAIELDKQIILRLESSKSMYSATDTPAMLDVGSPMDDEDLGLVDEDLGISDNDVENAQEAEPTTKEPDISVDESAHVMEPQVAELLEKSRTDIMNVTH